jgi:hypothetical protein
VNEVLMTIVVHAAAFFELSGEDAVASGQAGRKSMKTEDTIATVGHPLYGLAASCQSAIEQSPNTARERDSRRGRWRQLMLEAGRGHVLGAKAVERARC